MSEQQICNDANCYESPSYFLSDPDEIPRTIFWCACLLAYSTMVGLSMGNGDLGFVVGLGGVGGLGGNCLARQRGWVLRFKLPHRQAGYRL